MSYDTSVMAARVYGLGIFIGFLLLAGGALAARSRVLGQRNAAPVAGAVSVYTPRETAASEVPAPPAQAAPADSAEGVEPPAERAAEPQPAAASTKPASTRLAAPPKPVDINRASAAELQTLPGIGPVMANRIISYRNEHGPFRSTADLDNVKGIGPKKLEKLAKYIYVQ